METIYKYELVEFLENLTEQKLFDIYSEAECNSDQFSRVYENTEEEIGELFSSAIEGIRAALYGDYRLQDKYFILDGYDNLESSNSLAKLIHIPSLASYMADEPQEFKGFVTILEPIKVVYQNDANLVHCTAIGGDDPENGLVFYRIDNDENSVTIYQIEPEDNTAKYFLYADDIEKVNSFCDSSWEYDQDLDEDDMFRFLSDIVSYYGGHEFDSHPQVIDAEELEEWLKRFEC